MAPSRVARVVLFVVASAGAHAAGAWTLGTLEPAKAPVPAARAGLDVFYDAAGRAARPARARLEREKLVLEARAARNRGALRLGAFLLAANAIDAAEESVPFDLPGATRAFDARVAALRTALGDTRPADAAPKVFGDLKYTGLPGGRMGDALLRGSGSCEPVSQLVAAALHDAGLGDRAALRYYGGPTAGVTHLAAVVDDASLEWDLLAGAPSRSGGERFSSGDLVEVYARAHGIEAAGRGPTSPVGARASAHPPALFDTPRTRTLGGGYPPNSDRFDSPLPLYGARAVAPAPAGGGTADGILVEDVEEAPDPTSCVMHLPIALLDPPGAAGVTGSGDLAALDLLRQPSERELERIASTLVHVESTRNAAPLDTAEALIVDGCLAGLYERAGLTFALAGQPEVAGRAMREASAARERARPFVERALALAPTEATAFRRSLLVTSHGRAWVLLFLDGAEPILEALADETRDTYFEVLLVAGLVVSPKTRAAALERASRMKMRRRIDVMHEIFHAHDDARPWASNYTLDAPDGAGPEARAFVAAYDALRPLAFHLWEAPASPDDAVAALAASLERVRVDKETARAITGYYVRNFVGLYRVRPGGREQIAALDAALARAGLPAVVEADDLALNPSELEALGLGKR